MEFVKKNKIVNSYAVVLVRELFFTLVELNTSNHFTILNIFNPLLNLCNINVWTNKEI